MREIFDKAIAETEDPDKRALRELLREYFCNLEFREKFHDFVFKETKDASSYASDSNK